MPKHVLLLILASASIHVAWNALVKRRTDRVAFACLVNIGSLVLLTPLFAYHRLANPGYLDANIFVLAAVSGAFEGCYMITLYSAYRHADLSTVYPTSRGTAPVVTAAVGWFYVSDRISLGGALAVGAVIVGLVLVARSGVAHETRRTDRLGIALSLVTGVMIAGYQLVDRRAMISNPPPRPLEFLFLIHVSVAILLTGAALVGPMTWERIRAEWGRGRSGLLAVAVGTPLAFYFIVVASKYANVTYITAARNVGIVISTAVGALWLREKVTPLRLAGALGVVAGVVGLTFV